jgi:type I restriction enzyme S subunit
MSSPALRAGFWKPEDDSVPAGWTAVQLGEVAAFVGGGRLRLTKQGHYRRSGYPAFSAAGQDGYVERWEFDRNAVVVPSIGSIGRAYRAEGRWTTLANTQIVLPDERQLHHGFLHHRVDDTDFWPVSGTAQPFIKPSDLPKCWILLPVLPDQRRITTILDTLDEAIRLTEQVIEKLKQMKQGLLHDLLTRGIDDNGELRPPPEEALHLYKESALGWIPRGWTVRPVGALGSVFTGNTPSTTVARYYAGTELFVSPGDIGGERWVRRTAKNLSVAGLKVGRTLPPEAIMVTCIGILGRVGQSKVRCATNQQINSIVAGPGVQPAFLYHAASLLRRQLECAAGLQVIPIINKSTFSGLFLPLPAYPEQAAISARCDELDDRVQTEQSNLDKLRDLKHGLMDDLLTGRVRVSIPAEEQPA